MKLRVLAFALAILAFFLFVGSPFQQAANAIVLVDDAIVALVIAALAAFGITFTYTNGYYTLYDWVSSMIYESGVSFDNVTAGVNTTANILMNNRLVRQVSAVATYIKLKYNLQNNSHVQITVPNAAVYDELSGEYYVAGRYVSWNDYTTGTVMFTYTGAHDDGHVEEHYFRFNGEYIRLKVVQDGEWARAYYAISQDTVTWSNDTNMVSLKRNVSSPWHMDFMLMERNQEVYLAMWVRYLYSGGVDAGGNTFYKLASVSIGNSIVADTGQIRIPDDSEISDKSGIMTLPVPWGLSLNDVITEIPQLSDEDELEGNTTLTLESTEIVEGQIDQAATNEPGVSTQPSEYQVNGLQSVFPFCIPFDMYNFVSCLAADPVAPSFTWRFYVPGICDESIEIDLSEFDAAAQILRTMELLLFCVGLAFVTRKIIRG